MAIKYEFEAISAADADRLAVDCFADSKLQSNIAYSTRNGILSKYWAVDGSHERYLLLLPTIVREESGQTWYLFRWRGTLVRFATLTPFGTVDGDSISFSKPPALSQAELTEFLCDLGSAFAVHGRYGEGAQKDFCAGDRVRPIVVARGES